MDNHGQCQLCQYGPLRPGIDSQPLKRSNLKDIEALHGELQRSYPPSLWRATAGGACAIKKRNIETALFVFIICGAEGETRTPTSGNPTLDPEPSASTSSATSARTRANGCKRLSKVALNIFFYYACQGYSLWDPSRL